MIMLVTALCFVAHQMRVWLHLLLIAQRQHYHIAFCQLTEMTQLCI